MDKRLFFFLLFFFLWIILLSPGEKSEINRNIERIGE